MRTAANPGLRFPRAPISLGVPAAAWLVLWAFLVLTAMLVFSDTFPSSFDEMQHLSYLKSMRDAPTLFPPFGQMRVLDLGTRTYWTSEINHLNHPPLYYLLLKAITPASASISTLRLVNVAITGGAMVLAMIAAGRVLPGALERTLFAVVLVSFPKAAIVGSKINNDNLAAVAGSMVFAGMCGLPGAGWWIAGGLAVAGWTKLTALVALGAAALAAQLWRTGLRFDRELLPILAGGLIGAIPYLHNLATTGDLMWFDTARFWVDPAARPDWDFGGFTTFFFEMMAQKWGASEHRRFKLIWAVRAIVPLVLAGACAARQPIVRAYFVALALTLAVHLAFGWSAFHRIGDLTIAQTRYYNILWPGLALGIAITLAALWRRWQPLSWVGVAAILWPTAIGGMAAALI